MGLYAERLSSGIRNITWRVLYAAYIRALHIRLCLEPSDSCLPDAAPRRAAACCKPINA